MVFFDENHKQTVLGHIAKYKSRIATNPYDHTPTPPKYGGIFPDKKPRTAVKFPGEARGLFGAAVQRNADGTLEGVKTTPFNYTGRKVVGIVKWAKALEKELLRVLPLKGVWKYPGYGYQQRYPDTWQEEVAKAVKSGSDAIICITELIDRMIAEANGIYAGTPEENNFLIYHDGLSQYWESAAQEYIALRGYSIRLLRCYGITNRGTRYNCKVVGDSPERCRALDAHGFADLLRSMVYHVSQSSRYDVEDPLRFLMGRPDQVWSTMTRCWDVEPTSDRIVQYIMDIPRVLKIIVDNNGCVIKDICMRKGRRARRADDMGDCMVKPRARQRKATLQTRPLHPDCAEARQCILEVAGADEHIEDAAEEEVDQLILQAVLFPSQTLSVTLPHW